MPFTVRLDYLAVAFYYFSNWKRKRIDRLKGYIIVYLAGYFLFYNQKIMLSSSRRQDVFEDSRAVLGTSTNRSANCKLRTQGFDLRICEPISFSKHLRTCGKKTEIYRKSAKKQLCWNRLFVISKKHVFRVQCIDRLGMMYLLSATPPYQVLQLRNDHFPWLQLFLQQNDLA